MTPPGWRLLVAELRPYRRSMLAVAALAALLSVPTALSGLIVARALDDGFFVQRIDVGLLWLAILAQARLAAVLLTRILFPLTVRIVEPFRDALVTALVHADLDRALTAEVSTPGATVRQVIDEAEQARRLVASVLRNIHTTASVAAGAVIGLAVLAPIIVLVQVPCLLACLGLCWRLGHHMVRRQHTAIMVEENLAHQATTLFNARRDVIAFAAEDPASVPVRDGLREARRAALALARIGALRLAAVGVGVDLGIVLLLVMTPTLIASGRLSSGDLVAAVFYLTFGLGPAMRFLVHGGASWLVSLLGLMGRLSQVIAPQSPGPPSPASAAQRAGSVPGPLAAEPDVSLCQVSYAYSMTAAPVLDDVTLTIPYGNHVAVVGPSGSGKSTLAALICGLRAPGRGVVQVGGRNAAWLTPGTVALVPQEAYVFAGSLRDNLRYLAPDLSDESLLVAAHRFGLTDTAGPLGLDAEIQPGGEGLSAGQRQLITMVRTYLSSAPVTILDEAASHLDPASEQRAESAFRERPGTMIVIAHRISSAQRAEQVLLIDQGRLRAGAHTELIATSARYRELFGLWEGDPDEAPDHPGRVDPTLILQKGLLS